MEWKKAKCYSLEGVWEHWLYACKWSSNNQTRWQKQKDDFYGWLSKVQIIQALQPQWRKDSY
jgi:hypothetical protein